MARSDCNCGRLGLNEAPIVLVLEEPLPTMSAFTRSRRRPGLETSDKLGARMHAWQPVPGGAATPDVCEAPFEQSLGRSG